MTSRQATFSPRLSRCLSRVSHPSLPLSSVRRPVPHAKRAKIAKGLAPSPPFRCSVGAAKTTSHARGGRLV
jgi:hypothetical protein